MHLLLVCSSVRNSICSSHRERSSKLIFYFRYFWNLLEVGWIYLQSTPTCMFSYSVGNYIISGFGSRIRYSVSHEYWQTLKLLITSLWLIIVVHSIHSALLRDLGLRKWTTDYNFINQRCLELRKMYIGTYTLQYL